MTHAEIIWNILGSLAILLGVLAAYLRTRSERRQEHADTSQKIEAVHETVNGTNNALQDRIDQLAKALTDAGVPVPKSPRRRGSPKGGP